MTETCFGPRRGIAAATVALLLIGVCAVLGAEPASAAPGAWEATTSTPRPVENPHTATRLADGRVLVVGGTPNEIGVQIYDPPTEQWTVAANLSGPREGHTATLLEDGRVLVVGGLGSNGTRVTAVLFDPGTGTWSPTGSLRLSRAFHTANRLANGDVLVAGGFHVADATGTSLAAAEIYDVSTGTFASTDAMSFPRMLHASANVSSTRVLVAGGASGSVASERSAEIYNSTTGQWQTVGQMANRRRSGFTATRIPGGKVLVVGGEGALREAELFDPSSGSFTVVPNMKVPRSGHQATLLANGRVLVSSNGTAEIFNPILDSGDWELTASPLVPRVGHTQTRLRDGRVLAVGGVVGAAEDPRAAELFLPDPIAPQVLKVAPSAAWSGEVTLVVWQESAAGRSDIYGARIGADGEVLDPEAIPISTAPDSTEQLPSVAWNGTHFLVAWGDRRSGNFDVYGTQVSEAGAVLNPAGIPLSTAPGDQSHPSVRAKGATWLVVWEDKRAGFFTNILGTRVTGAGTVLEPSGIAISTARHDQFEPSVASNGTDWLVTWGDRRAADESFDIFATRVTAAGVVSNPSGVAVSTAARDQSSPSVAWNGTTYFAAWSDSRTGPSRVVGSRLTATGAPVDPSGITVARSIGGFAFAPAVTALGANFYVAWVSSVDLDADVRGGRVSSAGAVLDGAAGRRVPSGQLDQTQPAVAINHGDALVVYSDNRSGNTNDIFGALVAPNGQPNTTIGDFPIST